MIETIKLGADHVVQLNKGADGYRFIGRKEKVSLDDGDRFITIKRAELEVILGHPFEVDGEGRPTGLDDIDSRMLAVTMRVRALLDDNKNLSPEGKNRALVLIKEMVVQNARTKSQDEILQETRSIISIEESTDEIRRLVKGLKPRDQRKVLRDMRKQRRASLREHDRNIKKLSADHDRISRISAAYDEIDGWAAAPPVMQTPPATMFHHLRQAAIDDDLIIVPALKFENSEKLATNDLWLNVEGASFESMWADAAVFLVEHDWAAAFDKAADYGGGEIKLPGDVCVFEFRISGRHVIAVASEVDGRIYMQPIPMTKLGWLIPGFVYYNDGAKWEIERGDTVDAKNDRFGKVIEIVGAQIKAVAVALDAEVAASEVIRAPHKLNHARERRGKLPVSSYHIVSLARRNRAARLERDASAEPAYHVRMHFRRGHWRHFDDHKTWIKWMLVGDPDLGFVDKHYKL